LDQMASLDFWPYPRGGRATKTCTVFHKKFWPLWPAVVSTTHKREDAHDCRRENGFAKCEAVQKTYETLFYCQLRTTRPLCADCFHPCHIYTSVALRSAYDEPPPPPPPPPNSPLPLP
jgi:hypothetical protein